MSDIIKHLLTAAKEIVPAIVPGAGPAIKAGKAILDALEAGKDLVTPGERAEYDETIPELASAVNAHFDDTIGKLRGD